MPARTVPEDQRRGSASLRLAPRPGLPPSAIAPRLTAVFCARGSEPLPANADFNDYAGSLTSAAGLIIGVGVDGALIAFPAN
jgi:hypothetical protein